MGRATQDLRNEHEAIIYVLQILDRMMLTGGTEPETMFRYYDEVLYFLRIFADRCHHGKEENYLFKELVKRGIPDEGGPVGAMLLEHAQGRGYIEQMGLALGNKDTVMLESATLQYRDLLRRHIDKENDVLFKMADQVIDEESQELLFRQFEQHEESVVGHGVHERLHSMIDAWAKAFGME